VDCIVKVLSGEPYCTGGCPPKHKTLVLLFFLKAGIINPLFRLDLIIDAYPFLFLTWLKRFFMGRI